MEAIYGIRTTISSSFSMDNRTKCINCCSDFNSKVDMNKLKSHLKFEQPVAADGDDPEASGNDSHKEKLLRDARKGITIFQALDLVLQITEHQLSCEQIINTCGLCDECLTIFTQLFELYLEFVSLSKIGSFLRKIIQETGVVQRNLLEYWLKGDEESESFNVESDSFRTTTIITGSTEAALTISPNSFRITRSKSAQPLDSSELNNQATESDELSSTHVFKVEEVEVDDDDCSNNCLDDQDDHSVEEEDQDDHSIKEEVQDDHSVEEEDQDDHSIKEEVQDDHSVEEEDQDDHSVEEEDHQDGHSVEEEDQNDHSVEEEVQDDHAVEEEEEVHRDPAVPAPTPSPINNRICGVSPMPIVRVKPAAELLTSVKKNPARKRIIKCKSESYDFLCPCCQELLILTKDWNGQAATNLDGCMIYDCTKCAKTFAIRVKVPNQKRAKSSDSGVGADETHVEQQQTKNISANVSTTEEADEQQVLIPEPNIPPSNEDPASEDDTWQPLIPIDEFKCSKCPEKFEDKTEYKDHCKSHNASRFPCSFCTASFSTDSLRAKHLFSVHPNQPIPNGHGTYSDHRCQYCSAQFRRRGYLLLHLVTKHAFCPLCNCNQEDTQNHMVINHGTKWLESQLRDLSCDICGYKSKHSRDVKRHRLAIHNIGIGEFSCDVCGKSFLYKSNFDEHIPKHTNVKQFVCDECPMTYKYYSSLLDHKKTHQNGQEQRCHICDKSFTLLTNLQVHIRRVHEKIKIVPKKKSNEIIQCQVCEKTFTRLYGLKLHINLVHRGLRRDGTPKDKNRGSRGAGRRQASKSPSSSGSPSRSGKWKPAGQTGRKS